MFTNKYISTQTTTQISSSLKYILKLYATNGFVVNVVMMNTKLETYVDNFGNTEVNTTVARAHVGEIERVIRVVKERERCTVMTLPFKSIHKQTVIQIIYFLVMWINSIPNKNGISQK